MNKLPCGKARSIYHYRVREMFCLTLFTATVFATLVPSPTHAQRLLSADPTPMPTPGVDVQKLYHLEWMTRPDNQTLKNNVVESALGPFRSAHSIIRSETSVERAKMFGVGEASIRAHKRPGLPERDRASYEAVKNYDTRDDDNAIRAAVLRRLLDYRTAGLARDSDVQFISTGEISQDPSPDLIQALEQYPLVKSENLKILPASRAMVVRDDGIRDRMTGAYGPLLRVSDITRFPDGTAKAVGSFSSQNHEVYTRIFYLDKVGSAWRVTSEENFPVED